MRRHCRLFVALILPLVLVAGCGRTEHGTGATQVVAKVNGDEITVYQLNSELARNPAGEPDEAAHAKRAALERLIDLQLARQKAIEEELDRSPGVVLAIENAKTKILARAFLEQITARQPQPSQGEIDTYYRVHPELFARRKVYNIQEITIAAKEGVAGALREKAVTARSIQEIGDWLKERGVRFGEKRAVRAAEQIPLDVLPKLAAMKEGEIRVLEDGDGRLEIVHVIATKLAPVDEATATSRIQQFLSNRRSSEVIAAEMKRLRKLAKIQYVGEFVGGAPQRSDAMPVASTEAPRAAKPVAPNIEKGIRGLQ